MQDYSTQKISPRLVDEVKEAIGSVSSYGSVEIYVQDGVVTQISIRHIRKTATNGSRKRNRVRT